MISLNDFRVREDLIDCTDIDIEGEMYLVPLKRPWDTYVCSSLIKYSDIDDVCIGTALDFSKTYVFVFCEKDVYTIDMSLTEEEKEVLSIVVENI